MTSIFSGDWLTNLRNTVLVLSSLGGLMFGVLGAIAKLCDENLQIWSVAPKARQRSLWRVRAGFRVLFRRLYYSRFHDLFYAALEDSKSLLFKGLLEPDQIFTSKEGPALKGAFPYLFLLPLAVLFTWAYYVLLQTILSTPELVIPPSFKELLDGATPLIQRDEQFGGWEGWLVTLIALPIFVFGPIAFSIGWGFGVIAVWHQLIAGLPRNLSRYYAPFSAVPRLIVMSFALTGLALTLGKLTSPHAPIPLSPRLFVVNTLFDALSLIVAWFILRDAPWLGFKERPFGRLRYALLRLIAVGIATATFAIFSLYLSLVGTVNELPFPVVLNTFIARPTPPIPQFSLLVAKDSDQTIADNIIEQNEKSGEDKFNENFMVAYLFAIETGSERLFDRLEQQHGSRFSKEFRNQFNAFKKAGSIQFYGRSGYGPYFWLMHTTMFPIVLVSTILLVYASTFFLRIAAAGWTRRVSLADKPYNYVAVCCGLCAAFCGLLAYLSKL